MIRRGLSILLTLALVLALALSAGAAGTPTVRVETPETVKAGQTFEVRVVIENNPGLSAIQFTVSYDQKSLRCDECNTGSILSGTLSATNASGEDGAVLAAASVSPVKADGALGVLKFTALADGKPSFRLTDTVFAGSDAKEVDVTVASGSTSQQPDKSGETGDKTFTDTDGSFAEDAIEEAADLGLILGYEGKYRPADAMTRGECVTILYRAMGSPKVETPATFTDLTHNYYRDAIAWAEQNGVVNGVGNGKFNPGGSVTRAQLATILYRMAGSESGTEQMLTGMNAAISIELETREGVLSVPAAAICEDAGGIYLCTGYNAKSDALTGPVYITIGISDGENVEVTSGLDAGDSYCYRSAEELKYSFIR